MRLGSQIGSVVNHLLSRGVIGQPEPVVGMGATVLSWTDRHPATIIKVERDIVTVQYDNAERVDSNGMSEVQDYVFTRNQLGAMLYFRKDHNGLWTEVRWNADTNRWNIAAGCGLRIGERGCYHDFSF